MIHKCLSGGTRWSKRDIILKIEEAFNEQGFFDQPPGVRTIEKDLKNMREGVYGYYAPIKYDRRKGLEGYYYTKSNFCIYKDRELEPKVKLMLSAMLKYFSHQEDFSLMEIAAQFKSDDSYLEFEKLEGYSGLTWIFPLLDYIKHKSTVRIYYHSFSEGKDIWMILSPYKLKEYNNRWYLIGWSKGLNKIVNLGLERIKEIQDSISEFYAKPPNIEEYYRRVIGITVDNDKKIEKIIFSMTKAAARYMSSKPIHHSLKQLDTTDTFVKYEIYVIPNFELDSKLLSFGDSLEVIAPEWYRNHMIARIKNMIKNYH